MDDLAVKSGHEDAEISGGSLVWRYVGETLQQHDIVPHVGVVVGVR